MRSSTHVSACLLAFALQPRAAGEICVDIRNMPWALDEPLALDGMRGFPKAPGEGSTFDLRRVRSFHIFVNQRGAREGFSLQRVAATHSCVKQKTLPAVGFLPFVGQGNVPESLVRNINRAQSSRQIWYNAMWKDDTKGKT